MNTIKPENLGIRLYSGDFFMGNRKADLGRPAPSSVTKLRKEIKVTALSTKRFADKPESFKEMVEEREKRIEALLDRRGLLN
ncbi:hypothetical protein R0J87_15585 [Halomonas sp. SIMBA_159]